LQLEQIPEFHASALNCHTLPVPCSGGLQLLPQIEQQWEHQKANPQGCRVLAEHYPVACLVTSHKSQDTVCACLFSAVAAADRRAVGAPEGQPAGLPGPGGALPCSGRRRLPLPVPKGTKRFGTAYRAEHHVGLWPGKFEGRMRRADGVMVGLGPVIKHQLNETVNTLHMALSYHCCITRQQAAEIADVIDAFPWEDHTFTVQFSEVTCASRARGRRRASF